MKRIFPALILSLMLASVATAAPPKKYKDEASTWSMKIDEGIHLTFKFPQRIFLCPFTELSGWSATRWGGRCFHWMEIAHPLNRGSNCHYWAEIIEPDGELDKHAAKFLDEERMTTTYNETVWKPKKVTKTMIMGRPAYSAAYKTKLLSSLAKVTFHVSGTFWMFDIGKTRILLQADSYREDYDCSAVLFKAVSISKTPQFTDFKIVQTTNTEYRYLSMPAPVTPAVMTNLPDGAICTWEVMDKDKKIGAVRVRQTYLGEITMNEWKERFFNYLRGKGMEKPEDSVVHVKVGGRDAYSVDFATETDDDEKRPALVRNLLFYDKKYVVEIYAISYSPDKDKAIPVWDVMAKSVAGLLIWSSDQ